MSTRHRSRSRSPRRRSRSPRRKRSLQESPQGSSIRRTSPKGRHSDQEENKASSRAGKNDNNKDVVEDNQPEQRTDRFKSERFDSNDNVDDTRSKERRSYEGERRGGGYRGRERFTSQEWRNSSKLQESLSDPTHVPRLGQFFEHDNRDAPQRSRPPLHDVPPPGGEQGNLSTEDAKDEKREDPKDGQRPNTNRGRGGYDHNWGRQTKKRGKSPEVWKHDLFDVFDQSPSPPAEDEEESVKYRSVVQKVTAADDKWLHDKFEAESDNRKVERQGGRGADRDKWVHDKFEGRRDTDRRDAREIGRAHV